MILEDALAACPVAAILRGVRPDEVIVHAEALYAAGIRAVEVPLNSPDPLASVSRLAEAFASRMACGAGTVLSREAAMAVAAAGGRLCVAPNTDAAVIRQALDLGMIPVPGVASATEAFDAIAAGARHLKLFPAATYGPGHLRQLKAVLPPEVAVWAVGGVEPDAMAAWRSAGAVAFGLGSPLYTPGQTVEETAAMAERAVAAARALAP